MAVAAVVALIVSVINGEGYRVLSVAVRIVVLVVAVALAKYALGTTVGALKQSETEGTPVPAATRGVLFMNLKSGGGKAERFHLVDECTKRGIRPVVLEPGQDWLQVVRDVAASGVDVLGMAGGDGSQAMVGTVAAEMGLPMVVVPAGTRNHLALDLGLDRDDVVGALDGYGEAVERTMDLADVNGHVFVNNVSLGLYAAVVRSEAYRDAKVDTTLAILPQVLGPESEPFDLRFTGADGVEHRGAHIIQISNNPYGTTFAGLGSRPRMDTHQLGVVALVLAKRADAAAVPGRPRVRPSGALRGVLVVGDTDVRGHVRRPDRDGARRGDPGHGLAAAVLDPPDPGPRPAPEAGHRLLAGRPLARLEEVAAPVVGDRPRLRHPSERRARPRLADAAGGTARRRSWRPARRPGDRPPPRHCTSSPRSTSPSTERSPAHRHPRSTGLCVDSPGWRTTRSCGSEPRRRCSRSGDHEGDRAAATGLVAVGINSAVVNLPMKLASRRERPDRDAAGVPEGRHVPMPTSTSFPSGHSASAFAFAGAVGGSVPLLGAPLRGLAAAVAYSRVHTGVHYPGDVIVGSVVGATIGEATVLAARALRRRQSGPGGAVPGDRYGTGADRSSSRRVLRYQSVTTTAMAIALPSAQPATTSESQWTPSTSRLRPTSTARNRPVATSRTRVDRRWAIVMARVS